jgi:hypothetical protein
MMRQSLLTVEEKELLTRAARLMDELIETIEIAEDEELVQDIEAALKEVKEGKTRPLGAFIKELNLESEIQA